MPITVSECWRDREHVRMGMIYDIMSYIYFLSWYHIFRHEYHVDSSWPAAAAAAANLHCKPSTHSCNYA